MIVGRCADYILEKNDNLLRVFLYGDLKDRVARKEAMNLDIEESDMTKHVQNTDKKRSRYYRHYTGKVWGDRDNYDLCINTSVIGINETVELLKRLVLAREEEK